MTKQQVYRIIAGVDLMKIATTNRKLAYNRVQSRLRHLENTVIDASKGTWGVMISGINKHEITGFGTKADAVRVYAALKRNDFIILSSEHV